MTLKEIYEFFIKAGIQTDLRGPKRVQEYLLKKKKQYKKLGPAKRKFFDKEDFKNPYADSRILYGDPRKQVKRILVGIDIGAGELLLADRLAEKDGGFDLVLSHHPIGVAQVRLSDVMGLQTDLLTDLGVKEDVARKLMNERINRVAGSYFTSNNDRTVDMARLLNIPLMCCHTPADNHVARYLQKLVNTKKPKTLKAIVNLLMKEPEYRYAAAHNVGPKIDAGKETDKAGRIFVDMTGGTSGPDGVFARLSQSGIQTLLAMYSSSTRVKRIKNELMSVVSAGHMASDSLGMNLILDRLAKKGKIEIVTCSGFRRIKR